MHGLFIGLTTLDLIYLAENPPVRNQKLVASDYTAAAGGPATNAAVAFGALGGQASLLSVVGCHPMTQLIGADLQQCGVSLRDLDPAWAELPPMSSIIVTEATGDRAVISINAAKLQATPAQLPADILQGVDVVLLDGHQMAVGFAIAEQAKALNIPVVLDGGSWKPGLEAVLPFVNYAICSANFHPPNCDTQADIVAYLTHLSIAQIAITHGEQPIWYTNSRRDSFTNRAQTGYLPVPKIKPVDTLGAGDIFHGAFCHFILQTNFVEALARSAEIAARSCLHFGTRQWLKEE
ncbi:sugar kinase [Phormidium sp. CLA17]|uniref:sugar kinase n=1 Tax=Leptolyngbya sp. Cla-17 TaxID=2803751 RepID=UPI0014910849|nr:sugar kinase [Leptolyngbya sp. Cla-17]MBM0741241.1 sugar kinase [Leptolyngbya sp. Cla-17]